MKYSATELRKNIYSVLDSVLDSGNPVEIIRRGKSLRLVAGESVSRLDRLEPHDTIIGDSEGLEDIHWEGTWSGPDIKVKG